MSIRWKLTALRVVTGLGTVPVATAMMVRCEGEENVGELFSEAREGNGPIDAACKAIAAITGVPLEVFFDIHAEGNGSNSTARIRATVTHKGRIIPAEIRHSDIVMGAVEAYLAILNAVLLPSKELVVAEVR
ncbi:MAG: hypothetical protein HYV77_02405 [Candidatus Wildermuthbacteria bacterium]|nr:hypothetical protein [Candidatus Wildermuthbacteria bacterium]